MMRGFYDCRDGVGRHAAAKRFGRSVPAGCAVLAGRARNSIC
jgi:hypothetical protein